MKSILDRLRKNAPSVVPEYVNWKSPEFAKKPRPAISEERSMASDFEAAAAAADREGRRSRRPPPRAESPAAARWRKLEEAYVAERQKMVAATEDERTALSHASLDALTRHSNAQLSRELEQLDRVRKDLPRGGPAFKKWLEDYAPDPSSSSTLPAADTSRSKLVGEATYTSAGARDMGELRDFAEASLDEEDPIHIMLEKLREDSARLQALAERVQLLPEWFDYEAEVEAAFEEINRRRIEHDKSPINAQYVNAWHAEMDEAREKIWDRHIHRLGTRLAARAAGISENTPEEVELVEALAEYQRSKVPPLDKLQKILRNSIS